ncbi:hypothetical protein FOZ62_025200, partial [Perkinsus olseni]
PPSLNPTKPRVWVSSSPSKGWGGLNVSQQGHSTFDPIVPANISGFDYQLYPVLDLQGERETCTLAATTSLAAATVIDEFKVETLLAKESLEESSLSSKSECNDFVDFDLGMVTYSSEAIIL